MEETRNLAVLTGHPAGRPEFSHSDRSGAAWYRFLLSVERLSGTEDLIPVLTPESLLRSAAVGEGSRLAVIGELRSYHNRSGVGRRLQLFLTARKMRFTGEAEENRVILLGTLCRPPVRRTTPLGRQICDLMLCVSRRSGRTDRIPAIAWGALARRAGAWEPGTALAVQGRLQSRLYVKQLETGPEERTAYELSLSRADPIQLPACLAAERL